MVRVPLRLDFEKEMVSNGNFKVPYFALCFHWLYYNQYEDAMADTVSLFACIHLRFMSP